MKLWQIGVVSMLGLAGWYLIVTGAVAATGAVG